MSSTAFDRWSEPKDAGVASALVNTTQQVGGSLGTPFSTPWPFAAATYSQPRQERRGCADGRGARLHDSIHGERGVLAGAAVVAGVLVRASRNQVGSQEVEVTEPSRLEPVLVEESVADRRSSTGHPDFAT